jgi:hypothetical protein
VHLSDQSCKECLYNTQRRRARNGTWLRVIRSQDHVQITVSDDVIRVHTVRTIRTCGIIAPRETLAAIILEQSDAVIVLRGRQHVHVAHIISDTGSHHHAHSGAVDVSYAGAHHHTNAGANDISDASADNIRAEGWGCLEGGGVWRVGVFGEDLRSDFTFHNE